VCLQALAGELLDAVDVTSAVNKNCAQGNLTQPFSSCGVHTSSYGLVPGQGQSLRVSWTCICGAGNAPTVDPITGACTQCLAGAKPADASRTRHAGSVSPGGKRPGVGMGAAEQQG